MLLWKDAPVKSLGLVAVAAVRGVTVHAIVFVRAARAVIVVVVVEVGTRHPLDSSESRPETWRWTEKQYRQWPTRSLRWSESGPQ